MFRPNALLALMSPVLISGGFAVHLRAQTASPQPAQLRFKLQDERIDELSGLAASRRYAGHFWGHNDSGDAARLFLINSNGETVATVNLSGIIARDFEDMTFAGGWIYVGDIGDNAKRRESVTVHRLREPRVDTRKRNQEITVTGIETMTLRYPGGARDAETLAASPDGRLMIVSKDLGGSNFYALGAPFRAGSSATLGTVAKQVQFGATGFLTKLTTGGDVSSDGRKLVVQTYTAIYEYPLAKPFDWKSIRFHAVRAQDLPTMKQSESICYSVDGRRILVSSEGKGAPFYALESALK